LGLFLRGDWENEPQNYERTFFLTLRASPKSRAKIFRKAKFGEAPAVLFGMILNWLFAKKADSEI